MPRADHRSVHPTLSAPGLLALQRSAGNAAVSRLAEAAGAGDGSAAATLDLVAPTTEPSAGSSEGSAELAAQVRAEAAGQAEQVATATTAEHGRIDAAAAEQRDSLEQSFAAQQDVARAGRDQVAETLSSQSAQQGAALAEAGGAARRQIADRGRAAEEGVGRQVDELAGAARTEAARQAGRVEASGPEHAAAVPAPPVSSDGDVGAGQQRMHDAMTRKARTELVGSSRDTAARLRARDSARQQQVYGPARTKAAGQVRATSEQADRGLASGLTTARTSLQQTVTHARTSASTAHRTVAGALARRQAEATQQVTAWADSAKQRLSDTAARLQAALVQQSEGVAQAAAQQGPGVTADAVAAVREAGSSVVAAVGETGAAVVAGTGGLVSALTSAVAAVGPQLSAGFAAVGSAATDVARRGSAAFTSLASAVSGEVAADLDQAPGRAAATLAGEHERGTTELAAVADRSESAQAAWAADAGQRTATGAARYEATARDLGDQASKTPVQGWFSELIGSMRAWLRDKLGDVWGGIVSGLILSIPAIVIGVGLLLSGPVGWGVLIGLAVVGAGLGIYNRFSEYSADHGGRGPSVGEGFALVGLGIADLTGIPFIIEAREGRRAFAPQPMSEFERWERGTQGVVNLALMFAGGAKKLFGRTGEGRVPLPEPPPEVVPGERGPAGPGERAPAPAEGGQAEPATKPAVTRARMIELIRQIESGEPFEFTPEHAEALRMNAELATAKWTPTEDGRIRWDSIRNQLQLSRWRFLPQAPEVAAILRNALMRLPNGPERVEMLGLLDRWVGSGGGGGGSGGSSKSSGGGTDPVPVPVPVPRPPSEQGS